MNITIRFNNLPKLTPAMRRGVAAGFARSTGGAISELNRRTPVDTGELRASETVESDEQSLTMRATAPHSLVVHTGSRFMQGRPYMRDAIEAVLPAVVGNIANAVEAELK